MCCICIFTQIHTLIPEVILQDADFTSVSFPKLISETFLMDSLSEWIRWVKWVTDYRNFPLPLPHNKVHEPLLHLFPSKLLSLFGKMAIIQNIICHHISAWDECNYSFTFHCFLFSPFHLYFVELDFLTCAAPLVAFFYTCVQQQWVLNFSLGGLPCTLRSLGLSRGFHLRG